MNESIIKSFQRSLHLISKEVDGYTATDDLWEIKGQIKNSGGTLALHVAGNVNHFIGTTMGGTGYARNREAEFGTTGLEKQEVLKHVNGAYKMIGTILPKVDLKAIYPADFFGKGLTNEAVLWILLGHMEYHRGQINYHRRLV